MLAAIQNVGCDLAFDAKLASGSYALPQRRCSRRGEFDTMRSEYIRVYIYISRESASSVRYQRRPMTVLTNIAAGESKPRHQKYK